MAPQYVYDNNIQKRYYIVQLQELSYFFEGEYNSMISQYTVQLESSQPLKLLPRSPSQMNSYMCKSNIGQNETTLSATCW